MDQATIEIHTFCETVSELLGDVLDEKGFTFRRGDFGEDFAQCDFRSADADLRFVLKRRDGEVNCLIKYPKHGTKTDWVYLTKYMNFGSGMSEKELIDATDVRTGSIRESLSFYGPLLCKLWALR